MNYELQVVQEHFTTYLSNCEIKEQAIFCKDSYNTGEPVGLFLFLAAIVICLLAGYMMAKLTD